MNQYQKIALVMIRSFGSLLILYGMPNLAIAILMVIRLTFRNGLEQALPVAGQGGFLDAGFYYCMIGTIIYFAAKPIGRFVGKELDD